MHMRCRYVWIDEKLIFLFFCCCAWVGWLFLIFFFFRGNKEFVLFCLQKSSSLFWIRIDIAVEKKLNLQSPLNTVEIRILHSLLVGTNRPLGFAVDHFSTIFSTFTNNHITFFANKNLMYVNATLNYLP